MRKLLIFALLLISFASVSHSIASIDDIISGATGGEFWGWATLSAAAIVASSIILIFAYVWGTMFRDANMISFVKIELYEVIVTILILMFVLALVGVLSQLTISFFIPEPFIPTGTSGVTGSVDEIAGGCKIEPTDTIYKTSEVYFNDCVGEDIAAWMNMNYILNIYVDHAASLTPYSRPLGIGLISSPLAGLASPLKQLLYNATSALTIAYIVNYAQYYTFVFAVDAFLLYYLPIGIFFRSFTPTRRLGGTIIAITISFLVVFPFLVTLSFIMFYNDLGPMVTFRSFMTDYIADINFDTLLEKYMNPESFQEEGFLSFFANALGGVGNMLQEVIGSVFVFMMVFPISVIGRAFVIGYIIPAFTVLIFTQATISLSKSLGDEIDISSLTRMI